MARYTVIMRDATYMVLLQMAARQGKTMGKFLNELLDKTAKENQADGHIPSQPVCIVCGAKATMEGLGRGQQKLFVCSLHRRMAKDVGAYREL
jgi:hypothetical protein